MSLDKEDNTYTIPNNDFGEFNDQDDNNTRLKRKRSETKVKLGGVFPECVKIIKQLLNHKFAAPFAEPVDPVALQIPDYFDVIKNPMDLGTIQDKLLHGEYENAEELANDVNLVWQNCETYNGKDHDIVKMAKVLKKIFDKFYNQLKSKSFEDSDGNYNYF